MQRASEQVLIIAWQTFCSESTIVDANKIYVTDRKEHILRAGSPLAPIDRVKVNMNLRCSFTGNTKSSFFISAGMSSYIMKKEVYNFDLYDQGVYEKKSVFKNENNHSFCNLNLTVGHQYWPNKRWSIGFEPYFKFPLNEVGAGKGD